MTTRVLAAAGAGVTWSWDPIADYRALLAHPFMVDAFRAGTVVAVAAAVLGWFVVLRRESFAAHTLGVVGFPGAAGAVWLGLAAGAGSVAFAMGGAIVIAARPARAERAFSEESALVGLVQAAALALGFVFVRLYRGDALGVTSLLFGSFLGISPAQVTALAVTALAVLAVLAVIGRPLLFVSVDPAVAESRGVHHRLVSALFLVLLGVTVAAVSQISGALLVFALLVLPAAVAHLWAARPWVGIAASAAIGVGSMWAALTWSYFADLPIGFTVTTIPFVLYLASRGARAVLDARRRGAFG